MGNSESWMRCCLPPRQPSGDGDRDDISVRTNRVEIAATGLFSIPGIAKAYHTSVLVNGEEFFFTDSGIFSDRALTSHQGSPMEVKEIGLSHRTGAHLLATLSPYFMAGTYDLVRKNCNSFSDCALYYLMHQRLDPRFSALERLGQRATPELVNKFTNGMYQPNKAAASFRTEEVIVALEKLGNTVPASSSTGVVSKHALSLGARVTVAGLKSAESLNGQGAEVVRFNGINGRWEARLLFTGEIKAFKAENLRPAGELVLQPGDHVKVHSLASETGQALNGQEAEVVRYLPERSRYEVRLFSSSELKGLKAESLQRLGQVSTRAKDEKSSGSATPQSAPQISS